jgi:hypothetical protein
MMNRTEPQMPTERTENRAPRNLIEQEDDWEFALDILGTEASIIELQAHLDRAPNPESATAQFLRGFLASYAQHSF